VINASLNELVLEYQSGRGNVAEVVSHLAEEVYREPKRFGFDDEDAAADAMLKYQRRIVGFIDRFQNRGIAFDAYLGKCLRFLAKTVRRDRRRHAERDTVCERADFPTEEKTWSGDSVETRFESGAESLPRFKAVGSTYEVTANRLIFLLLKCVWEANDQDVKRVAGAAGVDPAWLGAVAAQARRALDSEFARFARMQSRRNTAWCRIGVLKSQIDEEADRSKRQDLENKLCRERDRLDRALKEIKKFKPLVPNSIVARILDVPKGTVDSGIYYLRKQLQASQDK
jgi:DNA-directed RNA polymerase specialized sigma24 family protein